MDDPWPDRRRKRTENAFFVREQRSIRIVAAPRAAFDTHFRQSRCSWYETCSGQRMLPQPGPQAHLVVLGGFWSQTPRSVRNSTNTQDRIR